MSLATEGIHEGSTGGCEHRGAADIEAPHSVAVTLEAGTGGEAGEHDTIADV